MLSGHKPAHPRGAATSEQIYVICVPHEQRRHPERTAPNAGYARGYHGLFASLTAWQIPLRPRRPVRQAVFLRIGALGANARICR
jgi:hypothetical protein